MTLAEQVFLAALAATVVGGAHYFVHRRYGAEWSFDEAGVQQAGAAVVLVTGIVSFLILRFADVTVSLNTSNVPMTAVAVTLAVLIVASVGMNRDPWVLARDEPAAVAIGAGLIVAAPWLTANLAGMDTLWMVVGAGLVVVGLAARYTDRLSGLFGQ